MSENTRPQKGKTMSDWNKTIQKMFADEQAPTRPQPSDEPVADNLHDSLMIELAYCRHAEKTVSETAIRIEAVIASALEAARREALEPVLPLIEAVAGWERQHGSACAMLPSEYAAFMEAIKPALLKSACRAVAIPAQSPR